MGLDPWKSTRLDRFAGSRVFSAANNESLCSADRLQTVRLSPMAEVPPAGPNTLHEIVSYQHMAHFLGASLRIGPCGTLTVMELLMNHGAD